MALKFFLYYLIVGQVIDWTVTFLYIWLILQKCNGDDGLLHQLNERYLHPTAKEIENMPWYVRLWRIIRTALLWPQNVAIALMLMHDELKEANAIIRTRAATSMLYPDKEEDGQ